MQLPPVILPVAHNLQVRTMLDHILATAQAFEREHGIRPNVLYLNPDHHRALLEYHPALFEYDPGVNLEFRLVIVPMGLLSHPQAAYVPEVVTSHAA